MGENGRRGLIAPGFTADLAVPDRNIFTANPMNIKDVEALLTLVRGKETHGKILPGWECI